MITINVSQEHIDKGKRINSVLCPVALAIVDTIKDEYVFVSAGYNGVVIFKGNIEECKTYNIPSYVKDYMLEFDHGHKIKPFSFTLNYPIVENNNE